MGENNRKAANRSWADPVVRARRIAAVKAAMNRPDVVAKIVATHKTEKYKKNKSDGAQRAWDRPSYRRKVLKAFNIARQVPGFEARRIEAVHAFWDGEDGASLKVSRRKDMKQMWKTAEYRDKTVAAMNTPACLKSQSQTHKKLWADKDFRAMMIPKRKVQANTPAALKANSVRGKKLWADPAYREKMMASRRKTMYGPGWGAKLKKAIAAKGTKVTPWNKGQTKENNAMLAKMSARFAGKIPCKSGYLYEYTGGKRMLMRSRWEVAFAQYLDSVGIKWLYEPRSFKVGSGAWLGTTYTPDFLVLTKPEFFAEIKGELRDADIRKMAAFRTRYPKENFVMYGLRELKDLGIDMRDWILKKRIAKISVKTDGTEKRASK